MPLATSIDAPAMWLARPLARKVTRPATSSGWLKPAGHTL